MTPLIRPAEPGDVEDVVADVDERAVGTLQAVLLSDHEDLAYGLLIFLSIVLIVTVGTESLEETIAEEVTENVGEEILDRRRDRINRRGRQERSFLPRIGPVTN